MKLVVKNPVQGTTDDHIAIAKRWYTEQRGRIVGNTMAWDDLPQSKKLNIVYAVIDTLEYMEESWQVASSSSSS